MSVAAYLSICFKVSMSIFKKITNIKNEKNMSLVFSLSVFLISLLPSNYSTLNFLENDIYKYLVLGIGFILSFLILLLAHIKKRRKVGALN